MLGRRALLLTFAVASTLGATLPAVAAETVPYTPQAFEAAQKAGEPILVEITAPWCPTCKAQRPILGELTAAPKFKALKIFDVDFDTQKSAVTSFGARMQSTLIVFKGGAEIARSVGDTKAASIADLLDKAI